MAPIRCCFDQTAVWHSDAARGPSTPSFNYLVGDGEQRRRHGEAEHPGGLEIDHQLKFGWPQHRQVRGLFAFENSTDIDASLAMRVRKARAVTHQTACNRGLTHLIACGQMVTFRQLNEPLALRAEQNVAIDQKRTRAPLR